MQKLFTLSVALTLAVSVACGPSAAQKEAEQAAANAAKAAEAAAKVAASATQGANSDLAKGMNDFAKAMSGLAGAAAGADGKPVETLHFDTLAKALPQVSGWEMEKPSGERMTAPFPISQTETTYKKGDNEIRMKVVDAAMAQMLMLPWSMMMATGYSKENSDGYEKAATIAGSPGFEKWDKNDKQGELNFLVNKRFMVTIEGRDLADTKVLHEFASKMDTSVLK